MGGGSKPLCVFHLDYQTVTTVACHYAQVQGTRERGNHLEESEALGEAEASGESRYRGRRLVEACVGAGRIGTHL